jgi:exonuclease SbcD
MRLVHTADWHLGRQFHNVSLIEDQAFVLEQLVELVRDVRPDIVVVAGDVYDRAVPPTDAVALLNDVLERLVLRDGVPVLLLAGNHDSPERLGFGAGVLSRQGCHVVGSLRVPLTPLRLTDRHGGVEVLAVPYSEPAVVRERLGEAGLQGHDAALRAVLAGASPRSPGTRRVMVGHCFVAGGAESESERPLSVGGAGSVGADAFAEFDYVALGHLHRPQRIGPGPIHYSGSLLKYSFSEAGHVKGVNLVELGPPGQLSVEQCRLEPRRDLRVIEGMLDDLLARPVGATDDYLLVRLQDRGAILDAMGKLRSVYPNVLHLERPGLESVGPARGGGREQLERGDRELFAAFFQQVTGDLLETREARVFDDVYDALERSDREA